MKLDVPPALLHNTVRRSMHFDVICKSLLGLFLSLPVTSDHLF